ncbi:MULTISPECIES: hypothetical protein [Pseudomonas]|uniref:Cupin n=2 Tax=Pseudomonas TaxID=286 RepID=A0A9X8EKW6_PSEPU|nr:MULTISPECIES: hypothetical protein [Pseudomonas]KTC24057.1 hypothetical protein AO392_22010 [Pseudomonas putida]MCP8351233.1 cupin [Pseudomonas sp. FBF18]MDD1958378.1 cupin [Pseudomonas sp. 8209]MEC6746588.1 cupin [Pseudomonas qingdaonensis]QVL19634.1 cupin [Pseudomonas qingdaonensis]
MKALRVTAAGLLLAACATTAVAAVCYCTAPLISLPKNALTWKVVPGTNNNVTYANVQGDILGNGAYEAFVSFRPGVNNGYHTHTETLPTVVLSGVFYARIKDKNGKLVETEYPAGSYYQLPAGLEHESGCKMTAKKEPCLLFQYQRNHFDLNPVPR